MKISRSTGYAFIAIGYIAENKDSDIVLSQDISRIYDIPLEYLLKILQQLVKANILRSKRGPHGGFSLAKPASKITMLEIIEAVEGPMANSMKLAEQIKGSKVARRVDKVFDKAVAQAEAVFKRAKLSTLVTK